MGALSVLLAGLALLALVLTNIGKFLAIGSGILAIGCGVVAFRRGSPRRRLFGALAIALGSLGFLLGTIEVALSIAAIHVLEKIFG